MITPDTPALDLVHYPLETSLIFTHMLLHRLIILPCSGNKLIAKTNHIDPFTRHFQQESGEF